MGSCRDRRVGLRRPRFAWDRRPGSKSGCEKRGDSETEEGAARLSHPWLPEADNSGWCGQVPQIPWPHSVACFPGRVGGLQQGPLLEYTSMRTCSLGSPSHLDLHTSPDFLSRRGPPFSLGPSALGNQSAGETLQGFSAVCTEAMSWHERQRLNVEKEWSGTIRRGTHHVQDHENITVRISRNGVQAQMSLRGTTASCQSSILWGDVQP